MKTKQALVLRAVKLIAYCALPTICLTIILSKTTEPLIVGLTALITVGLYTLGAWYLLSKSEKYRVPSTLKHPSYELTDFKYWNRESND